MSTPITISLLGAPQGKGRARAFVRGGHVGHYTPEKTRSYEGMIRTAAMQELGTRPAFDEPLEFVLRAVFPVPASWSERKRQQAITGDIKPGKKPDLDNIAKAWNDALNGVVYRDDSLICRMTLDKRYGPQPLVVCTVRPMPTFRDQHEVGLPSQVETKGKEAQR
ncbi:RusA family crossover junction endodeoxyribonuclease [Bradyrhizobium elkanii]|uniref:Holliday junction resolvase RusA-like endonuclease n=2 Tax=Bradyrhizobium elkanii TaxID=29448 RepID=A0ABV4F0R2_BRAEL|nr:RusA family crossover junction endodeoxyribonuclease [Bradyrhizobium elkanii]MCP1758022.1 Holliday junction resolvase RusA-like endonuclease [Bradyrhizobium elkanii]MCP1983339.1 Holliday junction resolvase RusA-like endonuclease [Bradyrhizobium elkanii]MCS3881681.1 Holliday junction resolvase RusA-like endonuclease [Bradyrhizobium elkanii]MCS4218439.1 Holliday junction resolvase RusA-like endonuclease [Bradyrhizobium elkanii]MCW2194303.1 Holliday junction resolvase RusA-like endonuclease [B